MKSKKLKRKYLHIEIMSGVLYIYAPTNRVCGGKKVTLAQIDQDCAIGGSRANRHVVIDLEDFLETKDKNEK